MNELRKTIVPKSDQLNSDDLLGGSITVRVTKVALITGEQPVAVHLEGYDGRPFKPCKSMRRVLIHIWGDDGNAFVGRRMTLYCDPSVMFAGQKVGGIRISHMSDMKSVVEMALTATRGSKKPFTVRPLVQEHTPELVQKLTPETAFDAPDNALIDEGDAAAEHGTDALKAFWTRLKKPQQQTLLSHMAAWKETAALSDAEFDDAVEKTNVINAG